MPPKIVNLSGFSRPEAEAWGGIERSGGGNNQGGGVGGVIA
jgi:hypothetical protein